MEAGKGPDDLKETIDELGLTTEEQFRTAAKRLKPVMESTPLKPDSNRGKGTSDLSSLSTRELISRGLREK